MSIAPTMNAERLLKPDEVCTRLAISRPVLRDLVRSKRLPCVQLNERVWRFRPRDLAQFEAQHLSFAA